MKIVKLIFWLAGVGLFLSACAAAVQPGDPAAPAEILPDSGRPAEATAVQTLPPDATAAPTETAAVPTLLPEERPPASAMREFATDFSKHSVPYSEILSGGPPRDGIPPIDRPQFERVAEAAAWLRPVEPVVFVQVEEDARAYPLQILTWHEIVNDVVGDLPLAVTFCPLCNTAIAFERAVDGRILDFGTTGRLRYSNLIMYDRQTETWWQQANGEAIVGELLGSRLAFYPAAILSWEEFQSNYPDGKVLSRVTGFSRPYGENPYSGYDDIHNTPFLFRGPPTPGTLPPVARVLTVDLDGEAVAYPYEVLQEVRAVNDTVGGQDIAVFWEAGTASALDAATIAAGRDVGAANAYARRLGGETLTFRFDGVHILDEQTNSQWNLLGQALSGELAGQQLSPVVAINHFWFSWAAFKPETRIYQP